MTLVYSIGIQASSSTEQIDEKKLIGCAQITVIKE